jgi:hypothetical protein
MALSLQANYTLYWLESQNERDIYEAQDIGGWIILRWILGWYGLDWCSSG